MIIQIISSYSYYQVLTKDSEAYIDIGIEEIIATELFSCSTSNQYRIIAALVYYNIYKCSTLVLLSCSANYDTS